VDAAEVLEVDGGEWVIELGDLDLDLD